MRAEAEFSGYSTLIRYKTNIDSDVNIIELPIWQGQDLSDAGKDRLCVILDSSDTEEKYQSSGHFAGKCGVDNSTAIMQIAKGDKERSLVGISPSM